MDRAISLTDLHPQSDPDLSRIHRRALSTTSDIRKLLAEAHQSGAQFSGGLGRDLDREEARIDAISDASITFRTRNFDLDQRNQVALTFRHKSSLYLFTTRLIDAVDNLLRVAIPDTVYIVERRERERLVAGADESIPTAATLCSNSGLRGSAVVENYSHDGVLLSVRDDLASALPETVELTFVDGSEAGKPRTAYPKNRRPSNPGWSLVGMHVTAAPPGPLIPVERRSEILGGGRAGSGWRRIKLAGSGARLGAQRTLQRIGWAPRAEPELELIRFGSSRGETLVGLVDSWNFQPGAPMVIIPPAWAKTKETLLPLARTIVSTFRRANQPIAVLRLDGIRRRGESYRDPQYRSPGSECLGMTFSQGAEDIRSAIRFASENSKFQADKIVLITFSGASIEARKVLAETEFVNLAGWISVVGAADLHSGLRVLSGGQDYIGGYERGVRFGRQRVLGIDTDADLVCEDALSNGLAHLEDARRQMAKISTPITWLQGRDDAWIDPEKVQEVLSCGDSSARRLIEVPTGHQLRTSHEALDVFQLIASEVGRFTTGNPLRPAPPDLADLTSRRLAERSRLPKSAVDLAAFWHDYVLGEGELPGMELLTGTTVYREMMDVQVNELRLRGTERVADLGSGTGTLTHTLASGTIDAKQIQVDEYDFLVDALRYSRQRIEGQSTSPTTRYINCDLSFKSRGQRIPASDESYDAAAMSLLINYVSDPRSLLREVHRILRIGGRIVLAALRPDTDISKIYVDSADEVRRRRGAGEFPNISHDALNAALASCLNEAARLVDLEEQGFFHFWEPDELAMMAREAGFEDIRLRSSFGQPPQAIIVSGMVGSK